MDDKCELDGYHGLNIEVSGNKNNLYAKKLRANGWSISGTSWRPGIGEATGSL